MAGLIRSVEDLVVEDGEVEGQTQADGVRGRKLGLSNLGGSLVGLERLVGRILALVADGELGEVAVVIALPALGLAPKAEVKKGWHAIHLVVEDLGLARLGRGDEVLVEDLEDVLADIGQLVLDLLAVVLDQGDLAGVALGLLLLLDGSNDSPRGTAGADNVLVSHREQIALLDRQVLVLGGDDLHVLDHLCGRRNQCRPSPAAGDTQPRIRLHTLVALSLLGKLGQVDGIFVTHFGGSGLCKGGGQQILIRQC